jgi:hypothetical protein
MGHKDGLENDWNSKFNELQELDKLNRIDIKQQNDPTEKFDKLELYYGSDYQLLDGLYVKHPKVKDIRMLGKDKYEYYVYLLTMTQYDIADILHFEMQLWYEDFTAWQLFIEMWRNNPDLSNALEWFTGKKFTLLINDKMEIYLYCKDIDENNIIKEFYINEHIYNNMVDYLRLINLIPNTSDLRIAGNRMAAEYILRQMYKKRNKQETKTIDLVSIISSIDWKGCRGNEIWEYPIYRIYEGYLRLNAIDNYDKTMSAYYSGNIDTTKSKINFDSLCWSNIINI